MPSFCYHGASERPLREQVKVGRPRRDRSKNRQARAARKRNR